MSEMENGQSTGIVGSVINELHQFEQKVETFLHPAASDNAPSSSEPGQGAGGAASGESVAVAAEASPTVSLADAAASVPVASSLPPIAGDSLSDAPAVGVSGEGEGSAVPAMSALNVAASGDAGGAVGEAGNVAAASGAIGGAPVAASPSAQTGLSSDQSGAATNGASGDANAVASSGAQLGESLAGSLNADTGLIPSPITGDAASATSASLTSTNTENQGDVTARTTDMMSAASELSNVAIDAGTAVLAAAEESASAAADALLARWHREMALLGRGLSAETEKLIRETAAYLGI